MKKSILLMVLALSSFAFGQNVKENRVTFNFIQLPTNPISEQYSTYNVVLERKYEKANEDSLLAYQTKLEQASAEYEAQMIAWREQKKLVLRDYFTKMSAWQKAVNGGNTAAPKPTDPIIPPQPVQVEVPQPRLHSDITDDQVINSISLAGYDKGEGGATITVGLLPLSNVDIKMTEKKSATSVKYTYTANYKLPLEVKVEEPTQGVVLQTIILNSVRSYTIGSYDSQYDFDLWWVDNEDAFWIDLEKKARNSALIELNTFVNNKCGYPVMSYSTYVYTVKKFKDHQYNDLTNAYTLANQGYSMISQKRDRSAAHAKINEAINIWKQMLTESDLNDRKARVNDKVTALLYTNLTEAYIWLSDFDTAEMYMNQAINSGVGKFKRAASDLTGLLNERKLRWNTNF
ncbi:MAG: hypothetical protein HUJ25_12000 [Crocinitomicaceae bacterium]|nr:hypothetical protein [Crocinitomicaceae bacterium]